MLADMKYYFYYLLLCTLLLPGLGCKKFLDEKPQTEITADLFWQSEDDIKSGMAAIYSGIQTMNSTNFLLWGDARSDNFYNNGTYGDVAYFTNGLSSTINGSDWSSVYVTINRANELLKHAPIIKASHPAIDPKAINHYMAEGYAIRAYCYFQLVKVWGAAPVWTVPFDSVGINPFKTRTPAATIIDSVVLPDLQTALSLVDQSKALVWEANVGSIYALLIDVSMWKHDNDAAINWFNKLNALKRYNLEPALTWKNLFIGPDKTVESIWSIYWDWTTDKGANISGQLGAGNTNSQFMISDIIWNYFSNAANSKDIRGAQSIDLKVKAHDKTLKFYPVNLDAKGNQLYPTNSQANVYYPLYRFADILLLRAEAANNKQDLPTALTYLNQVHVRAGLTAYTAVALPDSTTMSNAILNERQLELFGESKRFFDLVRNGLVIKVLDPIIKARKPDALGFGQDARTILWPLSRTVLNSNPMLTQNEPYN
jgi:hypothetical protein